MARSCRAPKQTPGANARPCSRSLARLCRKRGKTCGGGRMRGPLFDLLFTSAEVGAVATIAAVPTIAAWATLTFLVAPTHHRRRAGFELVDAQGEKADHILVDVRLALEFGDGRRGGIEVEHYVMRLAVL